MAPSEKWMFMPLTSPELQDASNREWPDENVNYLNRLIESFCLTPLDEFSAPKADKNSRTRARELNRQIAAISVVLQKLRAAGIRENALLLRDSESIYARMLEERRKRERELRLLQMPPGPRPNWALDYFIKIVADACHAAGVTVSAERNKWAAQSDVFFNGKLDGPFLRVLWLAHGRLPEARQAKKLSALAYRARDVGIPWWRVNSLGERDSGQRQKCTAP